MLQYTYSAFLFFGSITKNDSSHSSGKFLLHKCCLTRLFQIIFTIMKKRCEYFAKNENINKNVFFDDEFKRIRMQIGRLQLIRNILRSRYFIETKMHSGNKTLIAWRFSRPLFRYPSVRRSQRNKAHCILFSILFLFGINPFYTLFSCSWINKRLLQL